MILVSFCSCLGPMHWSQVLNREWRCSWSSTGRWCSKYIWAINNSIAFKGATYIRGLPVGCPSETDLKFKSRDVSVARMGLCNCPIILQFNTEHGCDIAVLCAKLQNIWTIGTTVMDKRNFARFQFKMSFGRISYTAQHPRFGAHKPNGLLAPFARSIISNILLAVLFSPF